jgi:NNP family nitrate/nitrite transporter-like MFS transporter
VSPAEPRGNTGALALGTAAFTICFFAWSMLGPLGPTLQDHLKLTDFQLALLIAVPVLMGSLMRIPLGVLTDRFGGRLMFSILLVFTLIPTALLALFHDSYTTMVAIGFFLGFAGASFAIGVPFVSRWFPRSRQGAVLGIYGMGMGGTVIAGLTAPWMAKHWGLAAPFWVAFAAIGAMALVFALLARDAPGSRNAHAGMLSQLSVVREDPRVWAPTFYYFVVFGGFVAMFAYLPKLLHGVHHLTKTDAGVRAAGFALLAVLARPVGGWLSDKLGADFVLRIALGATVLLAVGLAFSYTSMAPLTVCCLTMAVAFGLGTGAVFKLVAHDFPQRIGAVTGIVGAAGGLGGFFPPLVMAWAKTHTGSYELGFVLLALTALLAVVVLELMRRGGHPSQIRAAIAPDT